MSMTCNGKWKRMGEDKLSRPCWFAAKGNTPYCPFHLVDKVRLEPTFGERNYCGCDCEMCKDCEGWVCEL